MPSARQSERTTLIPRSKQNHPPFLTGDRFDQILAGQKVLLDHRLPPHTLLYTQYNKVQMLRGLNHDSNTTQNTDSWKASAARRGQAVSGDHQGMGALVITQRRQRFCGCQLPQPPSTLFRKIG